MKSIALIIPLLTGGGAERTISNLSIALSEVYDVHLIVFDGSIITYPYRGILHDLHLPASSNPLFRLISFWRRVYAIRKIKQENNIAASISFLDGPNLANSYSKVNDKIITSVRCEQSVYHEANGIDFKKQKRIQRIVNKKSDLIIAISEGVKKDLITNFETPPEKVMTIYNPCDADYIRKKSDLIQDEQVTIEDMSISTMGRLTHQKKHWALIRAFKIVLDRIPDAHLYIFGDGELRNDLEKLVTDLGMTQSVHFMGFLENPHVYIKKTKVFVFPSKFEGLGNVLLEAMACGVPCIASDCRSGPREIIDGTTNVQGVLDDYEEKEYGILVSNIPQTEINSSKDYTIEEIQISRAIIDLLTNVGKRKYYSKRSEERVAHFSPLNIKKKWIEAIEG